MNELELPEFDPLEPDECQTRQFSLTGLLLTIVFASVFFGVWSVMPGLGILMMICALPAISRTSRLAFERKSLGKPLKTHQKFQRFAVSLVLAMVATATLAIVAFGTFLAICATLIGPMSNKRTFPKLSPWFILVELVIGLALVFAIFAIVAAFSDYRWRRDTGESRASQRKRYEK